MKNEGNMKGDADGNCSYMHFLLFLIIQLEHIFESQQTEQEHVT